MTKSFRKLILSSALFFYPIRLQRRPEKGCFAAVSSFFLCFFSFLNEFCRQEVTEWGDWLTRLAKGRARFTVSFAIHFLLLVRDHKSADFNGCCIGWLGSRVLSVLDSGAEGPGSNRSCVRLCRVTVLGKLFTPMAPVSTKQRKW